MNGKIKHYSIVFLNKENKEIESTVIAEFSKYEAKKFASKNKPAGTAKIKAEVINGTF
jgi:hypothetical protein